MTGLLSAYTMFLLIYAWLMPIDVFYISVNPCEKGPSFKRPFSLSHTDPDERSSTQRREGYPGPSEITVYPAY